MLAWIIDTYQPLHVSEHPSFREMCHSLSLKAPTVGVHKLQSLLSMEAALMKVKLRSMLEGLNVSITTDAWTSYNICYDLWAELTSRPTGRPVD
jgi:hypothetical protein